ncbi:DUF2316 family protein [Dactylosporangium sp. NPDC050588]|uniref:DUF2316 family protein n=1 Tax=Dactylosporangium sp. NPDC050588 TaxID=3157211 RepID=UPI0033EE3D8E
MSLNLAEKAQTAAELQANQRLTGRTPDALAADLGFTTAYLDDLLHPRPAIDPAGVRDCPPPGDDLHSLPAWRRRERESA